MPQLRDKNGRFAVNSNGHASSSENVNNDVGLPDTPMGPWDPNIQRWFARTLIENISTTRREFQQSLSDPRRNINDECGYPDVTTIEHYRLMYDRETIARRVVEVLPQESWLVQPTVFEDEDIETETEFEKAWKELPKSLAVQSMQSWFKQEEGSPIWEYLRRADELSGIGTFGVILIGLNDSLDLNEEAVPHKGQEIIFIRTFAEGQVTVNRFDEDINSPRFGKPLAYNIQFSDPFQANFESETLVPTSGSPSITEREVHWTRCIHIADNLGSSEIFGTPRMQVPFNRLSDLRKIYGGSAEMYWKGAFPGLALTTHPQLGTAPFMSADEKVAMKAQMEQYMNGLQRYITAQGMMVDSLAPQVVDPTPQIDAYIKAICIQIGVPKRIFEGSERGELASSQDSKAWNGRLKNRHNVYLTPRIIVPFVDRLIWLQILPEPSDGYSVEWPDMEFLTEEEKATVAQLRMDAASKYVQGGVDAIMIPVDFFSRVLGMSQDEATEVVESAMNAVEGVDIPEVIIEENPNVPPVSSSPPQSSGPNGGGNKGKNPRNPKQVESGGKKK